MTAKYIEVDKERAVYERRQKLTRAAQIMQEWKKFLVKQWQTLVCLAVHYEGSTVTYSEETVKFSMCLNDTSRAVSGKLNASTLLTSVDMFSTWSGLSMCCQPGLSDSCWDQAQFITCKMCMGSSGVTKSKVFSFSLWAVTCSACWLEALLWGSVMASHGSWHLWASTIGC